MKKSAAVEDFPVVFDAFDGTMVVRGDLGVGFP